MRAQNKNFKKQMMTPSILIALVMALSGCPKNNTNTNVNPIVTAYASCTNCNAMMTNGQEFLSTESTEIQSGLTLSLGFAGQIATASGGNTYGYSVSQYQGAVAVSRGNLIIQQNMYQGYCVLPAGQYTVGTLSVGHYGAGIVQGLKLVGTGPAVLVINLNTAQISSQNNRDPYGNLLPIQRLFSTQTVIESVNGQVCNVSLILQ